MKCVWKAKNSAAQCFLGQTCWGWIPLISPLVTPPTPICELWIKVWEWNSHSFVQIFYYGGIWDALPTALPGATFRMLPCFLGYIVCSALCVVPPQGSAYFCHLIYCSHLGVCLTSPPPSWGCHPLSTRTRTKLNYLCCTTIAHRQLKQVFWMTKHVNKYTYILNYSISAP